MATTAPTPATSAQPPRVPRTPEVNPPNQFTLRVLRLAVEANLSPYTHMTWASDARTEIQPAHNGIVEIFLKGRGADSPMGIIEVGAASGRVLRGSVVYGNNGLTKKLPAARAVLAEMRVLASAAVPIAAPTTFEREDIEIDVTELRDGDRLLDLDGDPLGDTTVAWHRPVGVTYGGVPGTGLFVVFHNGDNDIFAAPQRVRVSRRTSSPSSESTP